MIDQLENAKRLACWLHDRTNDSTMPNDARHQVALSLFQLSLDVADAAIVLLDRNLPGPALMLSRSLIESYARGVWALRCAEDHEIDSFLKNGEPSFRLQVKLFWFVTRMYARFGVAEGHPGSGRDFGCSSWRCGIRMPCG